MILGTKARYAVMALVDIAKYSAGKPITLADIARRQEISLAYLEQIFPKLKKAGLVKPMRGPGGGYLLAKQTEQTRVLDIVNAVDESLQMTRCNKEHQACMSSNVQCLTHTLWAGLGQQIEDYLGNISLYDVCEKKITLKPQTISLPPTWENIGVAIA